MWEDCGGISSMHGSNWLRIPGHLFVLLHDVLSFLYIRKINMFNLLLYLQAAFMVPTELLAVQHYEHLLGLLERIEEAHEKPSVALLVGSTAAKEAKIIRKVGFHKLFRVTPIALLISYFAILI